MPSDPKCGTSWGGLKAEHCTVCHETFANTRAGDRHRAGKHGARFCRPPDEVGLHRDSRGIWRLPGPDSASRPGMQVPRRPESAGHRA
jgi:hypothetical protein